MSTYLADVVEPGDELEVRGPIGGWFVWDGERPAVGVAGGTGVVPLVAMLRHARDLGRPDLVRLAVSARTLAALPYARRAGAGRRLIASPARRTAPARPAGSRPADLVPLVEATPDADVFVCGSAGFAEAASRLLVDLGVQPRRRTRGAVRTHRLTRAAGPKPGADPGRSPEAAHPCPSLASQAPRSTRGRCPMQDHELLQLLTSDVALEVPLAVGLLSATGFAVANALQHRVAGTVPLEVHRASAVLRYLARRPQWLAATGISCLAMVCHALALRLGSITLVQPLMLVGVVLAVPLRAAIERQRPPWAAVRAVGVTTAGLALFLSFADLHGSGGPARTGAAFGLGAGRRGGRGPAGAVGQPPARAARPRGAARLHGRADVRRDRRAAQARRDRVHGAGDPAAGPGRPARGARRVVGLVGTAVNQRAYQIAPIAFSMPLVNVLDIVVALAFGAVVFQELPGPLDDRAGRAGARPRLASAWGCAASPGSTPTPAASTAASTAVPA